MAQHLEYLGVNVHCQRAKISCDQHLVVPQCPILVKGNSSLRMKGPVCRSCNIDGFHGGMASLPEGKSQGLCLAQLCAKYCLVTAALSPYH